MKATPRKAAPEAGPRRAKRGSIDGAILLRLPESLLELVECEAERAGVSRAEWIRGLLMKEAEVVRRAELDRWEARRQLRREAKRG